METGNFMHEHAYGRVANNLLTTNEFATRQRARAHLLSCTSACHRNMQFGGEMRKA